MRLIKPKVEIINQEPGVEGLFKHMELCARTCYKSEDKITEDSARKFINNVIVARGHTAMLEHGTVYLRIPEKSVDGQYVYPAKGKYIAQKYSIANSRLEGIANNQYLVFYVTTNYRVLLQNGWLDDLQYLCEPTEYHTKRITVRFVCDMGVAREFCRHRVFSFAQESTRYCNYAKDKFGKECTFIIPSWLSDSVTREGHYAWHCWCGIDTYGPGKECFLSEEEYENRKGTDFSEDSPEGLFIAELQNAEFTYFKLLEQGWTAQQARNVLPLALKTELIMTGTDEQWAGFFNLRCARDAHPQARELAIELRDRMILAGYINIYDPGSTQV